ncbi:MAG: Membrane-bound lytic murein transglycosylase D precursor [Syntrophorhabdaceae bacterium PtaU1.Bin034]|jgi:membrane-bound lytic murein transglycosylase D|nr:MAG: Membrane-bound lytic murein transglycosylase D precursor [Syntrophorhabdaceae bacterium PtaU1.Bin034]
MQIALFFLILGCLILNGCAGERSFTPANQLYPAGSMIPASQEPVKIAGGTSASDIHAPATRSETDKETYRNGPKRAAQKAAGRKKPDKRKVDQAKPSPTEPSEQTTGMSVLIRQDGADDENLASLLTPDYLRQFDIPIVFNDAVEYFVKYFSTEKRKIFANWLRRSRRYVPMIKEILRGQGLPEDLIYVAMIESGFNPKAYSSMKACGPWQFIYETGGRYGLRVNHWVDERRDPEKSTVAAALYLKDLFNQFGCWYLAAAGYNAGEKRIERAIEKHETNDFWELRRYNTLPRETREYIPRLIAAAIIAKDPEKFGFTNLNYDQPIKFVHEKVPGGTPLTVLAEAASTDMLTVRALNPEILTGITPPDMDEYTIKLPEWIKRTKFREELHVALEKEGRVQEVTAYTLKKRENLKTLMKRYKVTQHELQLVNACDQELRVRPGKVIYIPTFDKGRETVVVRKEEQTVSVQAKSEKPDEDASRKTKVVSRIESRTAFHIVKKGESLSGISEKYGIEIAVLKEINRLKKGMIHPNMRLALRSNAKNKSDKQFDKPEKKLARTVSYHVVKKGETLSGIAERYDTNVSTLKGMNKIKKGNVRYGTKLRVPSGRKS